MHPQRKMGNEMVCCVGSIIGQINVMGRKQNATVLAFENSPLMEGFQRFIGSLLVFLLRLTKSQLTA